MKARRPQKGRERRRRGNTAGRPAKPRAGASAATTAAELRGAGGTNGTSTSGANGAGALPPVLVTRYQLAAIAGVHVDRISTWTASGMPAVRHGGLGGDAETRQSLYDALEACRWIREHRHGSQDAAAARASLDRARRREIEVRLSVRNGELINRAEAERREIARIKLAQTKLLALPTRARQRIPHLTVRDTLTLEELIREALEELAAGR